MVAVQDTGRQIGQHRRLLLEALLLPVDEATASLCAWRRLVDLDDIDTDSFGLLPRLAARLDALGSDHDDDARIRGVARQTWARNELLLGRTRPAVEQLAGTLPAVVLIGDSALPSTLRWSTDRRLISGISLLIPNETMPEATATLESLGWTRTGGRLRSLNWQTEFRRDRSVIRVHRRILPNMRAGSFGREAFERAHPQPGWAGTRLVAPADLLVATTLVGRGARWAVELAELVETCSPNEVDQARATAEQLGLAAIMHRRLGEARTWLPDTSTGIALAAFDERPWPGSPWWRGLEDRLLRSQRPGARRLVAAGAAVGGLVSERRSVDRG